MYVCIYIYIYVYVYIYIYICPDVLCPYLCTSELSIVVAPQAWRARGAGQDRAQ